MDKNRLLNAARPWALRLFAGALAGLIASIPMAGVMMGLNRLLPTQKTSWLGRWRPLPPKLITKRMASRAGILSVAKPNRGWDKATWMAHLGYGAATASLYPVVTRPLPLPGFVRGLIFAMGVWATSYLGWLPAVNILPPATEEPARRNAVLILSHLVWGSLIGLMMSQANRRLIERQNS